MSARTVVARAGVVGAVGAVAAAACVEITAGPGGAASIRLDPVPPSIVVGDVLRDSLGNELRLRAAAFDADGRELADAPFRFTYVPLTTDTTQRDNAALVVDSLTGAVRAATPPFVAQRGRVGVRLGDRLQILDTLDIVPPPRDLTRGAQEGDSARVVYYDCRDPLTVPPEARTLDSAQAQRAGGIPRGSRAGNATPLVTQLFGDSAGRDSARIRQYLVRYELLAPAAIPTVQLPPPRGGTRAAIGIIDGATDTPLGFDTTDASGLAQPRLRIFPAALPGTPLADTVVTVRATARWRGTAGGVTDTVLFVVRFRPLTASPANGDPISCR